MRNAVFKPMTITAYFTSATAIYPGDQVRVAGVKVGTITEIEPQGTKAKMSLAVDRAVPVQPTPGPSSSRATWSGPATSNWLRPVEGESTAEDATVPLSTPTAPRCPSNGIRSRSN